LVTAAGGWGVVRTVGVVLDWFEKDKLARFVVGAVEIAEAPAVLASMAGLAAAGERGKDEAGGEPWFGWAFGGGTQDGPEGRLDCPPPPSPPEEPRGRR